MASKRPFGAIEADAHVNPPTEMWAGYRQRATAKVGIACYSVPHMGAAAILTSAPH